MNDASNILYAPRWVRILTILILLGSLAASIFFMFLFMEKDGYETYLLTSIALAQVSSSGLVFILVIFYSRKELGVRGLKSKSDNFLQRELVESLRKMDWHDRFGPKSANLLKVSVTHESGALICAYTIEVPNAKLCVRLVFNVRRIVVIYLLDSDSGTYGDVELAFEPTISGAQSAGYTVAIRQKVDPPYGGPKVTSLTFYNETLKEDFLLDPLERLFWSQDISLMTRDVLIQGITQGYFHPSALKDVEHVEDGSV